MGPESLDGIDGRRGWVLVGAAFGANFVTFGVLFSFGVFLTPIAEAFDTTTGPVSAVFSATVFTYYLSGALGGLLAGRIGVQAVVALGGALFSAALVATSFAPGLVWLYALFALPVGMGIGGCYSPMVGAVGGWFDRRRTLAIALVLTGVGMGTMVMPVVSRLLIDAVGWETALVLIGVGGAVVLGAAALASSSPPGRLQIGQLTVGEATRSPLFRWMYLSVVLIWPGFYAPLTFINDYAVERGSRPGAAALLVSVIGGASVVGRLFFGAVGDRVGAARQYRLSYVGMLLANVLWLLAGGSYPVLILAAVCHGIGWAAWVTAGPSVFAEAFGVADLGGVLGAFYTSLGLGGLVGPAIIGYLIDGPGFSGAIGFAVVCSAAAVGVLFAAPRSALASETRALR